MKHKTRPCAMCAAVEALRRVIAKGAHPKKYPPCQYCGGSGVVADNARPRRLEKRRKDMSGEEWTEADAYWERERERMEKDE